jgi:hypothetical protein
MSSSLQPRSVPRRALPLLRRTQLRQGESLPSLLERLVQLNHYPHARTLLQICRQRLQAPADRDNLTRPKWFETFLQLSYLTHISPEELFAACDHRFASSLAPPHQTPVLIPWSEAAPKAMLTPSLAHSRLRSTSTAQYCPACLQSSPYHRLSWVPTASTICLVHLCFLVDHCPQCQKRISVSEIVRRHCHTCQADLATAEAISVNGDAQGILSQQVIQFWLSVAQAPQLPPGLGLPCQPAPVLLRLLESLSRRLLSCCQDWPDLTAHIPATTHPLQHLPPSQAYHLLRVAFTVLLNWPQGLFQFLDACSYHDPGQTPADRLKRLEALRRDWFQPAWRNPDFQFVQQGYVDYLLARHLPFSLSMVEQLKKVDWFVEQTGLWTEERAAQALGVSIQNLRRFFSCDSLKACLWPGLQANPAFFARDRVLALQQKWDVGWSVSEASCWLGLYRPDVVGLVKLGVLSIVEGANEENETRWVISRASVEAFFATVANRLELFQGDRRDLASLEDTANFTTNLGIDRAALLQGVADGVFPAFKREPEIQYLGRLCFLEASLLSLPDLWYAQRGWVTGNQFARENGYSPRVVMDWVKKDLIRPEMDFGTRKYFVRQRLEQLAAKVSTPAQASRIIFETTDG